MAYVFMLLAFTTFFGTALTFFVVSFWKIKDCREDEKWDNGYHEMMALSGFLFGLPLVGFVGCLCFLIHELLELFS